MSQPTHTHKELGGRFGQVTTYWGSGPLDGQQLVVYQDLDRVTESLTTMEDWQQNWRPIADDDCTVCLGSGTDQIKGNKASPCGGCFGLGKVRKGGETPKDEWQLAEVALEIIQRQARIIEQRDQVLAFPEVQEVLKKRKERQQEKGPPDWVQREQEWRAGRGRGPGGARHTGD